MAISTIMNEKPHRERQILPWRMTAWQILRVGWLAWASLAPPCVPGCPRVRAGCCRRPGAGLALACRRVVPAMPAMPAGVPAMPVSRFFRAGAFPLAPAGCFPMAALRNAGFLPSFHGPH